MSVGLVKPQVARFDSPFTFANGEVLERHELVYETYGELNSAGDNAVLICLDERHVIKEPPTKMVMMDWERVSFPANPASLYTSSVLN